jgi:WhiB family redox-sensing transcriptional regulator
VSRAKPPPRWFDQGDVACKGHTATMYDGAFRSDGTDEAKAICHTCPHIEPCRTWARHNQELWGVWGGEGPRTRLAATQGIAVPTPAPRRKQAICGTVGGYDRHIRLKEPRCQPCKDAWNASKRTLRALGGAA